MGFRNPLTIVMYHYVRPIAGSGYPGIRGLEAHAFDGQLDYLQKHYRIIRPAEAMASLREGSPLPERSLMLTFDDGYKDHIQHVFPRLRKRGLTGAFFAPMGAIVDREMLDVNRIHYVLACVEDKERLGGEIENLIREASDEFELDTLENYRAKHRTPYFFDGAEVGYVKRLLQHALPEALRTRIASDLFSRHVSRDERAFAEELYMSPDDLRTLASAGMEIGSHGHRHYWLGRLGAAEQATDIDRSLSALSDLGLARKDFWFCYPYGSYDSGTLQLLRERGCAAAVTTSFGIAECDPANALELRRLDTVDLPRSGDAPICDWTRRARGEDAPSQVEKA